MFYDEIKGERQLKAMTETQRSSLQAGVRRALGSQSGKMREVENSKNPMRVPCQRVYRRRGTRGRKGTDASWLRMFEMEGVKILGQPPNFASKVNEIHPLGYKSTMVA